MRIPTTVSRFALLFVIGSAFVACGLLPAPFSMEVTPEYMDDAVAGQRCVLLVVVGDEGWGSSAGEAVHISATAPGAEVIISPQAITPGQVAEVTVIPDDEAGSRADIMPQRDDNGDVVPVEPGEDRVLTVTVRGEREGLDQVVTVTIQVRAGDAAPIALATEIRDKFVPWLAANHPDLGITTETEWIETVVRPNILAAMYDLFFSEEWEMWV